MVAKLRSASTNVIGQRLTLEMKKRDVNAAELARQAAVKTSFLYDIISGKSAHPSSIMLARVAEALGTSLTYLAGTTETSAVTANASSNNDYTIVQRLMVDTSDGGRVISRAHTEERYCFRRAWINKHLGVSPEELRMLCMYGDSMEPTLCHNDIILVDTTQRLPSPPGIFALFDGFGLSAKRLEYIDGKEPQRLRIMADNPRYSPYERTVDETFIIGRVVWFSREI